MRENALRKLWREDKPALGGWLSIPSSYSAETMAQLGFDWLCIDMQHGAIGYQAAVEMLQGISTSPTVPIVRVPWNDPAMIMKMLDAGAYGIIIPLINTRADAEAAVAACRYPPKGIRSFGPNRAIFYGGLDYFTHANEEILCIPMIETAPAMQHLDDILSVPGVDAIYIGPMDLSLALGLTPVMDGDEPAYAEARQRVVEACRRHGVVAGINSTSNTAPARIADGFRFVLVTSDAGSMARNAVQELRSVREAAPGQVGAGPAYQ